MKASLITIFGINSMFYVMVMVVGVVGLVVGVVGLVKF